MIVSSMTRQQLLPSQGRTKLPRPATPPMKLQKVAVPSSSSDYPLINNLVKEQLSRPLQFNFCRSDKNKTHFFHNTEAVRHNVHEYCFVFKITLTIKTASFHKYLSTSRYYRCFLKTFFFIFWTFQSHHQSDSIRNPVHPSVFLCHFSLLVEKRKKTC